MEDKLQQYCQVNWLLRGALNRGNDGRIRQGIC
jgi:hypothetical protein